MPPAVTTSTVICIMPVKNEAWILERSLACASLWADLIIVADQQSGDASARIARRFSKVELLENTGTAYSEHDRQTLLLARARQVPGRRVILSLDADEVLAANWRESGEWHSLLTAPEGTRFRFPKAELLPGCDRYWVLPGGDLVHGMVDDGSPFVGGTIHGPRLPVADPTTILRPKSLWLLHYRATDPERNAAKQRWYQCWEKAVKDPTIRPIVLYRTYHQDLGRPKEALVVPDAWLAAYRRAGIEMTAIQPEAHSWWDHEVVALFGKHGLNTFRKLDVFGPWTADLLLNRAPIRDPRNTVERAVHWWLRATQRHERRLWVRFIQRMLRAFGW